jgi:hypothetical protein
MSCEICKKKDEVTWILPIKRKGGALCTKACEACGRKSRAYCQRHDQIHSGFPDGTTACPYCVRELVASFANEAENITAGVMSCLGNEESRTKLREAGDASAAINGWPFSMAILTFVATKALRANQSVENVLIRILKARSADYIL